MVSMSPVVTVKGTARALMRCFHRPPLRLTPIIAIEAFTFISPALLRFYHFSLPFQIFASAIFTAVEADAFRLSLPFFDTLRRFRLFRADAY